MMCFVDHEDKIFSILSPLPAIGGGNVTGHLADQGHLNNERRQWRARDRPAYRDDMALTSDESSLSATRRRAVSYEITENTPPSLP